MAVKALFSHLAKETEELTKQSLFKPEHVITSPQQATILLEGGKDVLNLCANNYLGLCNSEELIQFAQKALKDHGYGMSSVRFICGTLDVHKKLEAHISRFLNKEDTILYSSCFDANGGLFETILSEEDAVFSDALNHASIIDGIRLSKAKRYRYNNNDMADLRSKLEEAKATSRFRLIATDGVFSMDGTMANLPAICDLADEYDASVMVDDSHATGFIGDMGRGTVEELGVEDRVDIITSTLGKALGGASGGFTTGPKELIDYLRQRSRPYLFSNTLAPVIATTTLRVLDMLESSNHLRQKLKQNSLYFREKMQKLGFTLIPGSHPIIPVMIGDEKLAFQFAERLLEEGIYVISFSYPVVPKSKARIRTQMSAAHDFSHLDRALSAFEKVGKELGLL